MLHDQMQFSFRTYSRSQENKHGIETTLLMDIHRCILYGDNNNSLKLQNEYNNHASMKHSTLYIHNADTHVCTILVTDPY